MSDKWTPEPRDKRLMAWVLRMPWRFTSPCQSPARVSSMGARRVPNLKKDEQMTDRPDNPPAFPGNELHSHPAHGDMMVPNPGMSLRDWFAGMALSGVVNQCAGDTMPPNCDHETWFATSAYRIADAMLAARGRT